MHGPAPRASGCGYAAPRGWPRAADALPHADGLALRMHGSLPRAPNRVHGHPKGLALWRYGPHTEGLELRMHGSLPRASSFSVRARPAGRRCKRVPRLVDQQLLRTEPMRPGLPPTPRAWRCGGTGPTPKASSCGCMAPYRGPRATCTAIPPRVWRCGGTGPTPKASSCGCMDPYRGPRASVCELVRLDGGPNRATRLVDQQLLRTEPMRPGLPPTPRAWRCGGTGPTPEASRFGCLASDRAPQAAVCELVRVDGGPNKATRLVDQQLLRTEPMRPGMARVRGRVQAQTFQPKSNTHRGSNASKAFRGRRRQRLRALVGEGKPDGPQGIVTVGAGFHRGRA